MKRSPGAIVGRTAAPRAPLQPPPHSGSARACRPSSSSRPGVPRAPAPSGCPPPAPRGGRDAALDGTRSREVFDAFEESHGRLVRRRVFACGEVAGLDVLSAWPGLRSVLATENIRSVTGRVGVSSQIRYVLSSRSVDDETLAAAIRRHWSIENGLHWVLEVSFDEDQSRVRDRTAAGNWALLRKIVLNLLQGDRSRSSVAARRKRAGWDDAYLEQLLHGNLMR